jgi:hypothetical protein
MVWKRTYAAGYVFCSRCQKWIHKDVLPFETYPALGNSNLLLHKVCNGRLRFNGRHKAHIYARRKQRERNKQT